MIRCRSFFVVAALVLSLLLGAGCERDTSSPETADSAPEDGAADDEAQEQAEDEQAGEQGNGEAAARAQKRQELIAPLSQARRDELRRMAQPTETARKMLSLRGLTAGEYVYVLSLEQMSGLQQLSLDAGEIDGVVATAIADSPWLEDLDTLILSNSEIGEEGLLTIGESQNLGTLDTLHLRRLGVSEEGLSQFSETALASQLTGLSLSGQQMAGGGVDVVAESPGFSNLESLTLSTDELDGDDVMAIVDSEVLEELRELSLAWNELGDDTVVALAQSPGIAGLEVLNLERTAIGDAAVVALAEATWLSDLRRLDLANNSVGDAGAQALAESAVMDNLESLRITGNPLDVAGIGALYDSQQERGEYVQFGQVIRRWKAGLVEQMFLRANTQDLDFEEALAQLATDSGGESVTPPAADEDPSQACPADLEFRVVQMMGPDDTPVFVDERLPEFQGLRSRLEAVLVPTEREKSRFGPDTDDDPVWVFSEDDGSACPMTPGQTLLIPGRDIASPPLWVRRLSGDCDLSEGRSVDFEGGRYFFAVNRATMPSQCRLQETSILDDEGSRDDLRRLKGARDEGAPLTCDDDTEGCEEHWQYLSSEFEDGASLVMADEAIEHPWPDDEFKDQRCGANLVRRWSSKLLFSRQSQYEEIDGGVIWPRALQLVDGQGRMSHLVFTDDEGRFTVSDFDAQGMPDEQRSWFWVYPIDSTARPVPTFERRQQLLCQD